MTAQINKNIGEVLRLNRIRRGITRKRMCRQFQRRYNEELKLAQLRRFEEGKAKIPADFLHKSAGIFNVDIDVFFKEPDASILINKKTKQLVEAYLQITPPAAQDALLYLTRHMAKG